MNFGIPDWAPTSATRDYIRSLELLYHQNPLKGILATTNMAKGQVLYASLVANYHAATVPIIKKIFELRAEEVKLNRPILDELYILALMAEHNI